MNVNKLYSKLGLLFLLVFGMQTISAKENKKDKPNFTVESLNFIHSDLSVTGGNLVFSDDAKLRIESKLNFQDKKIPDSLKIKVELIGIDGNNKAYSNAVTYWYYPNSPTNGTEIAIKSTPKNPIKISAVAHFVDDWQGETGYLKVDGKKTSFAILLNGYKQPQRGMCQTGKCYCLSGYGSGTVLKLGNLNTTQTLSINKEKNTSSLAYTIGIDPKNNSDFETIQSLIIWGELQLTAEILIKDEDNKVTKVKAATSFDSKSNSHTISDSYSAGHTRTSRISQITLFFTTPEAYNSAFNTSYVSGYKESTSNFHVWTEVWSVNQDNDICQDIKQNHVFLKETTNSKVAGVVVALNNTKEDKNSPLVVVLETNEASGAAMELTGLFVWTDNKDQKIKNIVPITKDENGLWIFKDSIAIKDSKNPPILESFQIHVTTPCNDKLVFTSVFKEKLGKKNPWDYKVKMLPGEEDYSTKKVRGIRLNNNSGIIINGGNLEIRDNATITFSVSNFLNKPEEKRIALCCVSYRYANGESGTETFPWEWSSSSDIYTTTAGFKASDKNPLKIESICLYVINDKNDSILYKTTGEIVYSLDGKEIILLIEKTEKIKYNDPCKTKYKLKEVTYSETNESGIYGLQFAFQFENNSDIPANVAMVVELRNCNGQSVFVKVQLKYDSKTNTYVGGISMGQSKDCPWAFYYGEIAAYNTCNDQSVWSIDASTSKRNSQGTKNASSSASTKPQLF